MNERDLFAAANAIADPAERLALLERECAHRPELRRRIERLINIPLPSVIGEVTPGVGLALKRSSPTTERKSEPVVAPTTPPAAHLAPADFRTRFTEFLAIHRRAVAASTILALVLVAVATWSFFTLLESERQSAFAEAKADAERASVKWLEDHQSREAAHAETAAKAEQERRQANLLRDQALAALQEASSKVPGLLTNRRNIPTGVREYVEMLARRWEAFASGLPGDRESRRLQADARIRAADLWRLVGRNAEAAAGYESACRLFSDLSESSSTDLRLLAHAYTALAAVFAKQGGNDEALAASRTAVSCLRRLASDTSNPEHASDLAQGLADSGRLLCDCRRFTESLEAIREAIDLQSKLVVQFPDRPDLAASLARFHGSQAAVLHRAGRNEEAIAVYRTSSDFLRTTSERHPKAVELQESLANAHANLAQLFDESNEPDAALTELRQVVVIRQALAGQHPQRSDLHQRLADARAQLADLLYRCNRLDESLREHAIALDLVRRLAAQDPGDAAAQDRLSRAEVNVGDVLREQRRPQDAMAHYRSARDVRSSLTKRFPEDRIYARGQVDVQLTLFDLLRHAGDAESAVVEYQSARTLLEKLLAQFPDDDGLLELFFDSQASYGEFLNDQGKPAAGVEAFTRAIDRLDQWATQNPKQAAANEHLRRCLMGRAQAYAVLQNASRAVRDADRVIQLSLPAERQEVRASKPGLRMTAGDVSGAVADVDQLARDEGWTASQWYAFACVNAAASTRLPSQGQELSRRAIDHLNKALKSGFKDVAHARRDPDLDPLRSRADFQKWLEELELLAPKPPVP